MLDLSRQWYGPSSRWLTWLLLPFSALFFLVILIRRWFYRWNIFAVYVPPVPVIVVGNITVGGTGKTPCVLWLVDFLRKEGWRPGIVSRGYGGKYGQTPYPVDASSSASEVGDEAVLLARHAHCPMVIAKNRAHAVRELLNSTDCNIVISDDGLQHYGLGRSIEIAVVDALRRYGNGYLLPAGPLREPIARLQTVDFILVNGDESAEYSVITEPLNLVSMRSGLSYPLLGGKVHAVAGIGHPQRFFNLLERCGYQVIPHVFPDHHSFKAEDINFADDYPVIMTEKDAVKCGEFADENWWYLRVVATMNEAFQKQLLSLLKNHRDLRNVAQTQPDVLPVVSDELQHDDVRR